MKRMLVQALSLSMISAAVVAAEGASKSPPSQNLIRNPSLEDAISGPLPQGWSGWPSRDAKYRREVVDGGHTGDKCLMIEGDGQHGVVFTNGIRIDRSKRYALKGWIKFEGDENGRALIKFNYFHNAKHLGLPDVVAVRSHQSGWQLQEKTDRAEEVPDASMLWVSCLVEGKGKAWFDDLELVAYDREDVTEDFDLTHGKSNIPPELKVLEKRLGTWVTETRTKPGVWNPDGAEAKGEETVVWALDKNLIIGRGESHPGDVESTSIMAFDPRSHVFRFWYFDNQGVLPRGESTGKWDETTQTLTLNGTNPEGISLVSTIRFVGDDAQQWSAIWKDQRGQILMEMESRVTRKP